MSARRTMQGFAAALVVAMMVATGALWAGQQWPEVYDPDDLMLDEEFQLGAGAKLEVDVSDVQVELVQDDASKGRVQIYATGRDRDDAREYFEDLRFTVEEKDNTLIVRTRRSAFRVTGFWTSSRDVRVCAVITVPKGTDMDVSTSDGDVRAQTLSGRLDVRTSDGSIDIEEIDGPGVEFRTSDGDIKVGSIRADEVKSRSSDGNVRAENVTGKDVSFSTSDGNVEIGLVEAESVYLRSSDGDIGLAVSGGKVRAHTSDGDIHVTLRGETGLDLRTSDGDIDIDLPAGIGADLNLKGERVRLTGGINIDGEVSTSRVRGSLGGGGVEIVARTNDGDVSIAMR